MPKLVRDIMRKGLLTCDPDTPLGQVAILLTERRVHALIVSNPTGAPLGLISDFDLLAGEWLSTDQESLSTMKKLTAKDLMTSPIDAIEADATVERAAHLMLEKQIHRLMVSENDKPTGVISISDIVASIAGQTKARRDTVADVMSDAFLVCRNKTTVVSAARTLTRTHWRSVIVVDEKGRPQGVVTGKDLLWHVEKDGVYENLTVGDVMNHSLTTIDVHASLHEAANLMIQNHIHRLIVTDKNEPDGFPVGIISSFDIVAEMARPGSVWQG
ncbi:MAG TPA: CBS domain-containing protein [Anaerolineales bacterium]|nr:CBS domain-containing protein [Anaerolineales bacterium]